jgi:long-chain acyl-CoA synthetase
MSFPRWTRSPASRLIRRLSLRTWVLPFTGCFMEKQVVGLEHVLSIERPVIFAANHQSHMDTPAIYGSLPAHIHNHIAPAMAKEFFNPSLMSQVSFYMACQCFNAFPIPQRESPRAAFRYMRELVDEGYSILIYPEGQRTNELLPFRRGVGMIAIHLNLPVIPVRIEGLERVLNREARWPTRGPVHVTFGAPLRPDGEDSAAFTARIEAAVHALGPRLTAPTAP